jgi:predicted secreted hydrolase
VTARPLGLVGLAVIAAAALLLGGALLRAPVEAPRIRATLSVADALRSRDDSGFARARAPRPFAFPRDHGPHPGFRTEWWYYTGNLRAPDGRHFGYQLTFFRVALAPAPVVRASAWGASEIYMAHFALTDVAGGRFHAFERLSRAALGLAGAASLADSGLASRRARDTLAGAARLENRYRVWLEDWTADAPSPEASPMRLRAAADGVAIELALRSIKPVALQGDRGLSQKGPEPGNASYYYSLTRMDTRGTVTVGGETWRVAGSSWMDREWSTSALGAGQVGWDWFALQLDDGRDLMFYRLRRRDGSTDRWSRGILVARDGSTRPLGPDAVRVEALDTWRSPKSGVVYPSSWRVAIPAERLEVEVVPWLRDQELDLSVRYWEGAVRVAGTAAGEPVTGNGYVELTGYSSEGGFAPLPNLPPE